MSVELHTDAGQKAVVFTYDKSKVKGKKIHIHAENAETGDVGTREATNTGSFVLFYPAGFSGTDHVTVRGAGKSHDEGTVTI